MLYTFFWRDQWEAFLFFSFSFFSFFDLGNSYWLPLISKKAFSSLLSLSSSLNVEVLLSRDCVAGTVLKYPMFILTPSPFSITAHRGWKSQTLTSPGSLIWRWSFHLILTTDQWDICRESLQKYVRYPLLSNLSYADVVVGDIVAISWPWGQTLPDTEHGQEAECKEPGLLGCHPAAKSTLRPPTSLLNK